MVGLDFVTIFGLNFSHIREVLLILITNLLVMVTVRKAQIPTAAFDIHNRGIYNIYTDDVI
jgi:hypothetical protein